LIFKILQEMQTLIKEIHSTAKDKTKKI